MERLTANGRFEEVFVGAKEGLERLWLEQMPFAFLVAGYVPCACVYIPPYHNTIEGAGRCASVYFPPHSLTSKHIYLYTYTYIYIPLQAGGPRGPAAAARGAHAHDLPFPGTVGGPEFGA